MTVTTSLRSNLKGRRRPYVVPLVFFRVFFLQCVFSTAILFTVRRWPTKHALRQTATLPHLNLFVNAIHQVSSKKARIHLHLLRTTSRSVHVILVLFESRKAIPAFVIQRPLTRINALLRYCFTKPGAPLEAKIGGNMNCWHCCRSSMLNCISGARARTFFELTNR